MPLVVPGLMSDSKDKSGEWQNKLMGKKLGDSSDNIVRLQQSVSLCRFSPDFYQDGEVALSWVSSLPLRRPLTPFLTSH